MLEYLPCFPYRLDLRQTHRIFSIDPPGCEDIDDAISVVQLPNGIIQLGVHIADVTHFVQRYLNFL